MFNLREYRTRSNEERLADLLPWAMLIDEGIVEQKDGILQKTIQFRGPDLASSTRAGLIANTAVINNALKRLGSGWSFFFEAQRCFATQYPDSIWPNRISELIDKERRSDFQREGNHFDSGYYLTLVYAPPTTKKEGLAALFFGQQTEEENLKARLSYFKQEAGRIVSLLRQVMPFVGELNDDETLTYLHSTISTKRHLVKAPEIPMYLDAFLVDQSIEHGMETKLGNSYLRTVTIRGFPGTTFPGILDSLNELEIEYRWVSRYIAFGKEEGRKELNKYRKLWYGKRKGLSTMLMEQASQSEIPLGNTDALNKSSDADEALQELENDYVSFGHFTATVTVWGETRAEADGKIKAVETAINGRGFVTHLESLGSSDAWLGSLPGHVYANVWRPIVNSLNLAHMLPLSAVWAGNETNQHLNAPCHMVVRTRGSTPFRFSTNVGDVGHTLILGPTGAGKSTLLSFMALQWLRYKNAQVYIFDKGGSARAATLGAGGDYFIPGANAGELVFQPLRRVDDEKERVWAKTWIEELLESNNVRLGPNDGKELWAALSNLGTMPLPHRTLSTLYGLIQSKEMKDGLLQFTLSGAYGDILDAAEDTLSDGTWQTFELERLMEQRAIVAPVLTYLFHRLESRFTGAPTLLILDEAWLFLDHPVFAAKIREWLKVLRKANVYVVFATQSIADAMNSKIAPVILESCLTKIYLPNVSAKDESTYVFYKSIGLNERQIEIICHAIPKRDHYYSSSLGNRLFELGLGPVALAFCASSTKDDHRLMDAVLNSHGRCGFAEEFLCRKSAN